MNEARLSVRSHPDCLGHRPPPGHPDSPLRLVRLLEALGREPVAGVEIVSEALLPPIDDVLGVLEWVHDRAYVERVRAAAAAPPQVVDSDDCPASSGTFSAATASAGLALGAALDLVNSRLQRAFLAIRPPSHHAERSRARGYCFFNVVALAAEVVVRSWSAPVLIVDFDLHHGNGTQAHFWERPDVGYVSVHAYPGFPGSGRGDEVGAGPGRGLTRNVPLAAGAGDELWANALADAVEEVGSRLRPGALVVSAGFGAHRDDLLGSMEVTETGFGRMTSVVVEAAEAWAGGRVVSLLEGGFAPVALLASVRAHLTALAV